MFLKIAVAYQFEVLNATDEVWSVWSPTLNIHAIFKKEKERKRVNLKFMAASSSSLTKMQRNHTTFSIR